MGGDGLFSIGGGRERGKSEVTGVLFRLTCSLFGLGGGGGGALGSKLEERRCPVYGEAMVLYLKGQLIRMTMVKKFERVYWLVEMCWKPLCAGC